MEAFAVAVIPLAGAAVGAGVAVGCVGATVGCAGVGVAGRALPGLVLQSAVPALQLETELLQAC